MLKNGPEKGSEVIEKRPMKAPWGPTWPVEEVFFCYLFPYASGMYMFSCISLEKAMTYARFISFAALPRGIVNKDSD